MALTIRSPRQAHNTVQKQLAHLGVTFKGHTISFEWETRHPYMQINAMKPSSTNWSKHVEQAWKQSQRGRRGGYYSLVRAYRSLSARRHPYVFTNRESDTSLDDSATQRYLVVGMALPTDDPKDMQESQSAKRQVVGINDTAVKPTVIHEEDDLPMLVVVAIDDCANAAQIKTYVLLRHGADDLCTPYIIRQIDTYLFSRSFETVARLTEIDMTTGSA